LTLTVAAFDWIMSLDPHWYSTIFGVYFFAGSVVAVFSTLILLALALSPTLGEVITEEHFHDLGKLLFAFVVFWAYIAFSQFMLIWYGNIPEETLWYAHRTGPGWEGVTVALAAGHFVLPFFVLLSRDVKRRVPTLAAGAVWMLAMHYLDLYWLVMPSLDPRGLPEVNREFNLGMPANLTEKSVTLNQPEPLFPVKCDVHPWMNAWVAVMTHPFWAVTGEDGAYTIEDLPAGTYTIEAWHERLGTQTSEVTVADGETATADFAFAAPSGG